MTHGCEGPAGAAAWAAGVVQADQLLLSRGDGVQVRIRLHVTEFYRSLYFTEPPSPLTSSPSDMSSVACGQSGHTTPMEDSDKRKCTFNFYFNLIWSERMKKTAAKGV